MSATSTRGGGVPRGTDEQGYDLWSRDGCDRSVGLAVVFSHVVQLGSGEHVRAPLAGVLKNLHVTCWVGAGSIRADVALASMCSSASAWAAASMPRILAPQRGMDCINISLSPEICSGRSGPGHQNYAQLARRLQGCFLDLREVLHAARAQHGTQRVLREHHTAQGAGPD